MSALAAIHAKRRQVHSLKEDDAWRDFVEKHTGVRSTRSLTPNQTKALLAALDHMGAGKTVARRKPLTGPYAKKIQALWISCFNLGLIDKLDDKALNAFAVKQASVDHTNWIRDPEDAVAVIEALKAMLVRRGVEWANVKGDPDFMRLPGFKIAVAQWDMVRETAAYSVNTFQAYVRQTSGKLLDAMEYEDWIVVMNQLGKSVRSILARAETA